MKTIFVSSTFSDMQSERDVLQEKVLPIVNMEAKKYGDVVSFCDLRWGVNTLGLKQEAGEEKVLDICLDMIDRCDPIMIIILGGRYGWIPDPALVKSASERKNMTLESYEMSVTALEIEYGAFFKKKNTLVYYRETEGGDNFLDDDPVRVRKLQELKSRIDVLTGGKAKKYKLMLTEKGFTCTDDFVNMVADDVCSLLSERWKEYEKLSALDRELLMHRNIFQENASVCSTQGGVDEKIVDYVKNGNRHIITLNGASGTGKSVALGKVFRELENDGYTVLPFSVGYTVNSATSKDILESIVCWFEEKCGYSYDTEEESVPWYEKQLKDLSVMDFLFAFFHKEDISGTVAKYGEYCKQYDATGKKLAIIVDGIDKLHNDAATDVFCFIPENIYALENVRIIFSSVNEFRESDKQAFTTETYDEEQNRRILLSILEKNNREIDLSVEEEILKKSSGQYPQYIKLLVTRLLMLNASDFKYMTDMKNISEYQKGVVRSCSDSLDKLALEIITRACRRTSGTAVLQALKFMSVTREGLTEEQLRYLCKGNFNKLDFYHLISYMGDSFIMRDDGRYDFKTSYMKEAIFNNISDPEEYAVPVMDMFVDKFFNEEAEKPAPDYTMVQEVAKLASVYCCDEGFLHILKRFYNQCCKIREKEDNSGAFACMDVFIISTNKEGDRLAKFAYNVLDSYCSNSCNYDYYDVLFVVTEVVLSGFFEIEEDDGGKKNAERIYRKSLKVCRDLPEEKLDVHNLVCKANIAQLLFDILCSDNIEDEETAKQCFDIIVKEYPQKLQQIKDATVDELFDAYDKILQFAQHIQEKLPEDDPFSDELRIDFLGDCMECVQGMLEKIIAFATTFEKEINAAPEAAERPYAIIINSYIFMAKSLCIMGQYEDARSAYALTITFLSIAENVRAKRYNYHLPSLSELYEELAKIEVKIGTKESLTEAITHYGEARDNYDGEGEYDMYKYYLNVEEVYVKLCELDSSAAEGRIANLKATCSADAVYIWQKARHFKAYISLGEIYEDRHVVNLAVKYYRDALDIIVKLAKEIKGRVGDSPVRGFACVVDPFSLYGEEMDTSLNNNFYIGLDFGDDVQTADDIFDKLAVLLKNNGDSLKLMSLQAQRRYFDKIISTMDLTEEEEDEEDEE